MGSGNSVEVVFLDFAKAFDKVSHIFTFIHQHYMVDIINKLNINEIT